MGELFVRYWMHMVFILKDGEKMFKSLGNFVFVDCLCIEWDLWVIRLGIMVYYYWDFWLWDDGLMLVVVVWFECWLVVLGLMFVVVMAQVRVVFDDDFDMFIVFGVVDAVVVWREGVVDAVWLLGIDL